MYGFTRALTKFTLSSRSRHISWASKSDLAAKNFRDNWDLAAARASSVVQELEKAGNISTDRMKAVSFGESKPIDSNETAAGREKNRRIEIEINF